MNLELEHWSRRLLDQDQNLSGKEILDLIATPSGNVRPVFRSLLQGLGPEHMVYNGLDHSEAGSLGGRLSGMATLVNWVGLALALTQYRPEIYSKDYRAAIRYAMKLTRAHCLYSATTAMDQNWTSVVTQIWDQHFDLAHGLTAPCDNFTALLQRKFSLARSLNAVLHLGLDAIPVTYE